MKKGDISRRTFLAAVGATPAAASLTSGLSPDATPAPKPATPTGKLRFGCMVTFEDWAFWVGTWGEIGIRYVIKRLKSAGFHRVYWRTSGCGQAAYPSRITNSVAFYQPYDPVKYPEHPQRILQQMPAPRGGGGWNAADWAMHGCQDGDEQFLDFSKLDSVRIARDYSRKLGLEFYLWHEHAEDHGGIGEIGTMGLRHPEWFTLNRDRKRSRCRFSMAIPAAMEYRLAWVRELLEYEPDGIYLDLAKSMESTPGVGITPHFDEKGVWYCGYDDAHVEAFKKKTGRDPFKISNDDDEWVRFRASYMTEFLRRVRQMQQDTYPKVKIGLFGTCRGRQGTGPNDKYFDLAAPLRSYLEDHEAWTREGLLDEFVNNYATHGVVAGLERIKATIADSRSRVHPPCRYRGTQLEVYTPTTEKPILEGVQAAAEAGCEEIVFFESTPLQWNNTWDGAYKAIKQFGT